MGCQTYRVQLLDLQTSFSIQLLIHNSNPFSLRSWRFLVPRVLTLCLLTVPSTWKAHSSEQITWFRNDAYTWIFCERQFVSSVRVVDSLFPVAVRLQTCTETCDGCFEAYHGLRFEVLLRLALLFEKTSLGIGKEMGLALSSQSDDAVGFPDARVFSSFTCLANFWAYCRI